MNHKKQSNLEGKNDVFFPQPHTFSISKRLTADSMMKYCVNGKCDKDTLSHLISRDPVYVWNKLYGVGNKFSLAKCANNRLAQIIQKAHPELYETKEKKKLLYKAQ